MNAVHSRTGFIGGSDARRIIEGDWLALYEEKVGIRQPADLSSIFRMQLGVWTEPFHFAWLRDKMLMKLETKASHIQHPSLPWCQASIDGWWLEHDTFVELKHTNERASVRSMSETYQPQIAHYCAVFGVTHGYLSFIAGNNDPVLCKVEPSRTYIDELVDLETAFWWHVENQIAPDEHLHAEQFAEVHAQARNIKVDGMRFVDMTGNNHWADLALAYVETKDSRDIHERAKDEMKKLVPRDAAEATGHGVKIKRNKAGSLSFYLEEQAA